MFSSVNVRTQRFCSKRCGMAGRDMSAVRRLRRDNFAGHRTSATCESCKRTYAPASARQRNCAECSPTKGARARLRRYGVSNERWLELVAVHGGLCWICQRRPAVCLDHDHESFAVRGALCRACNMALGFLEDASWLESARTYLSLPGQLGDTAGYVLTPPPARDWPRPLST